MINLNQILEKLSVTVLTESLGAEGPRGVALAATNVAPAIIVNSDYRANRHPKGQRFTLAHEFCHILYDQGSARRVTHASTPWAPVAVERRANAFAAMLLMPRSIVRRTLTVAPEHLTLEGVAEAANRMDVGIRALIHHLGNMREFGPDTQGRLMADLDADSDSKDWGAH
jgi:Zn-dependent peptidase ImmA (M78 family)